MRARISTAVVSLLTDISSEMIFTLLPLFLSNVLGATATIVGLVGGISESSDAIFRLFSGWFSDRLGKRKLLARINAHAKADRLVQGTYGSMNGAWRGCAVSCSLVDADGLLDGKSLEPTRSASVTLEEMDRGEHMVSAELVDARNRKIASASPVTFYVRQYSINFGNSPSPSPAWQVHIRPWRVA